MPWNEADRAKYDGIRARYSSDMSEAEFALIGPVQNQTPGANPSTTTA